MSVEVSDSNAMALPWTMLEADMPAAVAAGMDEAQNPTDPRDENNRHVQQVTEDEKEQIEQVYRLLGQRRTVAMLRTPTS